MIYFSCIDKGIHVGNNSTAVNNPPSLPNLPPVQTQNSTNRRLSVIDRMRQYISTGSDGMQPPISYQSD